MKSSSSSLALVSAAAIASSSSSSCLVSAFVPTNQNHMLTAPSSTYARANDAAAPSTTSLAYGLGEDLSDLTPSARKKRAQRGDINPAYSMQSYLTNLLDLQGLSLIHISEPTRRS